MDLAEGICLELCECFWGTSGEQGYIDMSYSLNSLKGGYIGNDIGDYYRGY